MKLIAVSADNLAILESLLTNYCIAIYLTKQGKGLVLEFKPKDGNIIIEHFFGSALKYEKFAVRTENGFHAFLVLRGGMRKFRDIELLLETFSSIVEPLFIVCPEGLLCLFHLFGANKQELNQKLLTVLSSDVSKEFYLLKPKNLKVKVLAKLAKDKELSLEVRIPEFIKLLESKLLLTTLKPSKGNSISCSRPLLDRCLDLREILESEFPKILIADTKGASVAVINLENRIIVNWSPYGVTHVA